MRLRGLEDALDVLDANTVSITQGQNSMTVMAA